MNIFKNDRSRKHCTPINEHNTLRLKCKTSFCQFDNVDQVALQRFTATANANDNVVYCVDVL